MTGHQLAERLEVLRDEALNSAEYGDEAPGAEIFDAVLNHVASMGDTDPGLDMSLREAISRRLAWGENPITIVIDCDSICKRLVTATQRSFPDAEEATKIVASITDVACAASRHIARMAVQGASKERAQQRREAMVQRQLAVALDQQRQLIEELESLDS